MKYTALGFGLLALIVAFSAGYYWLNPTRLQVDSDIDFSIVDGRTLNLKQLQGRPVLVVFWATTCPGCIEEMPHLIELYQDLAPRGLEIIAVAMAYDPPNQVMEIRQRKQIPYPIALDVQSKVAAAYGDVQQTPTTFLIDPQGRVVQQTIGRLNIAQLRADLHSMLLERR
jgi:peroxiredoxin